MAEEVRKMSDDKDSEYRLIDIGNMFIDQCDRALVVPTTTSPASSSVPQTVKTANMFAVAKPKKIPSKKQPKYIPRYMPELQTTDIRIVDPYEDPGVWAIVDDGCNSCVFSKRWRLDAQAKWERQGFRAYVKSTRIASGTNLPLESW